MIIFSSEKKGSIEVTNKTQQLGMVYKFTDDTHMHPSASAGLDKTITTGQKINFDGSWSSTFGSKILKYLTF